MVKRCYTIEEAMQCAGRSKNVMDITLENRYAPKYLSSMWDFLPDETKSWKKIKVPSFWGCVEQFAHEENWKEVHTAFYAIRFNCFTNMEKDRAFLCFQGVSTVCEIYLNRQKIGEHGGKFTPFEFDVTEFLKGGENELCVVVGDMTHAFDESGTGLLHQIGLMQLNGKTPDPFMPDYHFFGGIWQAVYVERRPAFRIDRVKVETSVRNHKIGVSFRITGEGIGTVKPYITEYQGDRVDISLDEVEVNGPGEYIFEQTWMFPKLWEVGVPNLYMLHLPLHNGGDESITEISVRFGFREFWIEKERLLLNGKPIKLFGDSIHFNQQILSSNHRKEYMVLLYRTLLERACCNCVRLTSMIAPKAMVDAADETGMLVIHQSGIWSLAAEYYANAGKHLLENLHEEWREWIWRDINAPSVIIWDAENEQLRISHSNRWVLELDRFFEEEDLTRPIIHSGAGGFEKRFPLYHIHHNEQYSYLLDQWESDKDKPLVMGEWWIGGRAGMPRNITGRDHKFYSRFAEDMAYLYRERIIELRMRGVSGIMPFNFITYLMEPIFDYRQRVALPDDGTMQPCPDYLSPYSDVVGMGKEVCNPGWDAARPAVRLNPDLERTFSNGFAPLAAFFVQRSLYVQKGKNRRTIRVQNDSPKEQDVALEWKAMCDGKALGREKEQLVLAAGEQADIEAEFYIPDRERDYQVMLDVQLNGGHGALTHSDCLRLMVLAEQKPEMETVLLYDSNGNTKQLFTDLGIKWESIELACLLERTGRILVIGENILQEELGKYRGELSEFVQRGGRILVLAQCFPGNWLPVVLDFQSCELQTSCDFFGIGKPEMTNRGVNYGRYFTVYAQGHPLFKNVPSTVGAFCTGDGRVIDDVYIKPITSGMTQYENLRVLSGGTKQNQISAWEYFERQGCWLMLQYRLVDNARKDPMARRLLNNALAYLCSEKEAKIEHSAAVLGKETADKLEKRFGLCMPQTLHLPADGVLFIGAEVKWNSDLQNELEPWIRSGGMAVLLDRADGEIEVFGNTVRVQKENCLSNGLYVRSMPLTWGMHGTDLEAGTQMPTMYDKTDESFPVAHALLMPNAPYGSRFMTGDAWEPIIELANRHQTGWWYHAPNHSYGDGAVLVHHGRGGVLLWQIDLFRENAVSAHFARTLFVNLGISVPRQKEHRSMLRVFRAVDKPVDMDIDKWLNDMDDINLQRNKHAVPMALTADMVFAGSPRDNADISGIAYMMFDDDNFYWMFQVADNQIVPGEDGCVLYVGEDVLSVRLLEEGGLKSTLNGKPCPECSGKWKQINEEDFHRNCDAGRIIAGISSPYFTGYRLECFIPRHVMGMGEQKEFPLRVELRDKDADDRPVSKLSWPGPLEHAAHALLEN